MYKVVKAFKCRHQKMKVFNEGSEYKSVNKEQTEKLLKLGFIKEVPKKRVAKKSEPKKVEKEESKNTAKTDKK